MADRIAVGLLGGVEVRSAGESVQIAGAKLKAIVAMLALGAPHPVSDERLIDQLWANEPPAHPANALQGQISSLRRLLGRDSVERRGPGYVLAVGPEDVDTIRFERLIRAGRDAAADNNPQAAASHHRAALTLLRGRPLDDLGDYPFARDAAARLDELVLDAQEGLAEAQLVLGGHAEVVSTMGSLVRLHPLRERFHAQLVLALYRCGRQADALRAYQDARSVLVEELGVDPGPELQALERAVLAHDPSLDHAVASNANASPPVPAPSAPSTPDRLPLAGRDAELRSLLADLDAARTGHGRVTLLGGEPGIGKTRLTEELTAAAATAHDVTVVWGRCYEGRGAPAFWPWTQIVNGLLARFDPDVLRDALGDGAADLAQIAPEVKEIVSELQPPPPLDPAAAQFHLYQAMSGFLRRLARTRPLVLVVDDLHWADGPSLGLIAFVASEIEDVAALIVGTYRNLDPTLGGSLAETLVELSRRSAVRRLDLVGLDREGIGQLLAAAGTSPSEEVLGTVHRRTQGNPFFVTELLRLVPAESATSEHRAVGRAVPVSVKGVIRQRVTRLPESTRRTIVFAATLGQDFDLAVLAATLDVDGATLLDHLEPAIEAGMLVDNPEGTSRYRFSHGLVNETIYDDLGAAQRPRVHHRIAQTLETHHGNGDGPHLLSLAAHWFHAVPAAEPDRGIDYALRAADWALAHVAHQQAKDQLQAALELIAEMPEEHERAVRELQVQDQLCVLLIATTSYSDPEFGRVCARVRDLCELVDDHVFLAPALYRLSLHHVMRADVVAGVALGEQLLDPLRSGDSASAQLAGHIALGVTLKTRGDQIDARRHFDQAIAMCDEGHDAALVQSVIEEPAVLVRIFAILNRWLLGDEDRAEQEALDNIAIAARNGMHTWSTMVAYWGATTIAVLRRDAPTALQRCDDGIALAIAGGYGLGVPYMGVNRGWAIGVLGDVDTGAQLILDSAALAEAFGALYIRPMFFALHAEVCLGAGRLDDAVASVDRAFLAVEATGERWYEAELHRLRGEALIALGRDPDEARNEFRRAIEVASAQSATALRRRAEVSLAASG